MRDMKQAGPAILAFLLPAALWLGGCTAPKAVPIEGQIAERIRQGIENGRGYFDHAGFDSLVRQFARPAEGRFDYAGLKEREADLDRYLGDIARADLAFLSRNALLALFINAYNAYTLRSVLQTMTPDRPEGIGSIRDIPDVFEAVVHEVGGFTLSLDNIEHNILRPVFKDPRIHFAVNCASVGCPPLHDAAFIGEDIEAQLEAVTQRVLTSPEYVRVEGERLWLTSILDWYGSDFVTAGYRGAAESLAGYVQRRARREVREFIEMNAGRVRISFIPYDWSLNRIR